MVTEIVTAPEMVTRGFVGRWGCGGRDSVRQPRAKKQTRGLADRQHREEGPAKTASSEYQTGFPLAADYAVAASARLSVRRTVSRETFLPASVIALAIFITPAPAACLSRISA